MRTLTLALISALAVAPALAPVMTPGVAEASPKGCPPGLAKKNNGCQPPGQAKKNTYGDRERVIYRTGDIWRGGAGWITDFERYRLEPRDGRRYVRSGDRIYVVDAQTQRILDILALARYLIN